MCLTELLKKNQSKNFVKKRISLITKYFGGSDPMNELLILNFLLTAVQFHKITYFTKCMKKLIKSKVEGRHVNRKLIATS